MERIFTYIVEIPCGDLRLAGASPLDWLERAFQDAPHAVISDERDVTVPAAEYLAVIPSSMPLVTPHALEETVREAERRAISALDVGQGRILSREAARTGVTAKRRLVTESYLSLNDPPSQEVIERELYRRNSYLFMQKGAVIPDVDSVRIDYGSEVAKGAYIAPFTFLKDSKIGANAVVGPFSQVERSTVEDNASVLYSVVQDSVIGRGSTVGPFAYVRMGSRIGEKCRIGDFVEVKNSAIANGAKAAHLTYVGDADVGIGTNIGCGTVFANYDGEKKHKTKVGDHAFIGANTNLIAPINVGDDVYIAAATTVTRDVPSGSFVIGRSRAETRKRERKC